jgi:hypothetical protein
VMKILAQNGFQQCFWSWKSHRELCINAQEDYLEGDAGK